VYPYQLAAASMLIYDIDNQIWSSTQATDGTGVTNFAGAFAFTTIYGRDIPVNEIMAFYSPNAANVIVRSWLRDDTSTTGGIIFVLNTFPLNFDGLKTRKQLVSVNLHATNGTYRLVTTVDESTAASNAHISTFIPYTDPMDSIYGPVPINPADGPTVTDSVVLAAGFAADGKPIVGYRFSLSIQRLDVDPGQIYAIDIAYADAEAPGEGDA
jgi:hypothetical protein